VPAMAQNHSSSATARRRVHSAAAARNVAASHSWRGSPIAGVHAPCRTSQPIHAASAPAVTAPSVAAAQSVQRPGHRRAAAQRATLAAATVASAARCSVERSSGVVMRHSLARTGSRPESQTRVEVRLRRPTAPESGPALKRPGMLTATMVEGRQSDSLFPSREEASV
jgi:hypothetical protein